MKGYLENLLSLRSKPVRSKFARSLTVGESQELERIFTYLSKKGQDPNVANVHIKQPFSQRQILFILNSDCSELIEAMFQIIAISGMQFHLEENNSYSFLLFLLFFHPELLPTVRTQRDWRHVPDCTDTLKEIRVYTEYYRRPKRTQRHKGYRDKGNLPDEQFRLRQECLSDYYAEEAKLIAEHDSDLRDTIELFFGYLS